MARLLIIAGTGTDVGKTHVCCALLGALRARGTRVAALKPVATGAPDGLGEDAPAHALALAAPVRAPQFALADPIAPSLAALREGNRIAIDPIAEEVRGLASAFDDVVVETAGGLFTPLGREGDQAITNATLAAALLALGEFAPRELLLVAPDRIGVLHDLGAALTAARALGLARPRVVLSAPAHADASTGTNADELRRLGIADVAAVFPRAGLDAPETASAAARALAGLAGLVPSHR